MAKVTKEKALADKIGAALDTLDFNFGHFALAFGRYGSAVTANCFELVLTLLNGWAADYELGDIEEWEPMYRVSQMSYVMVNALHAEQTGRHAESE